MKKLFIFENIVGNYCSGDYYFLAETIDEAVKLASDFQIQHNNRIAANPKYTIEFDLEEVSVHDLDKSGYFGINRTKISVTK